MHWQPDGCIGSSIGSNSTSVCIRLLLLLWMLLVFERSLQLFGRGRSHFLSGTVRLLLLLPWMLLLPMLLPPLQAKSSPQTLVKAM